MEKRERERKRERATQLMNENQSSFTVILKQLMSLSILKIHILKQFALAIDCFYFHC